MRVVDERDLFECAQKSASGFGKLFDAYFDRIYTYAYRRVGSRDLAQDIAASVFEDALKNIQRAHWQDKPIIAWLYRIAARRVADYYRGRRETVPLSELTATIGDHIGSGVEREDEYATVRRGIAQLNEREREIIRLTFFDGLDGKQIAATLGCTSNSAYVRLHRALKKLKVILEQDEN